MRSKKGEVPLRQRVSMVDWQGWFGLAKKAAAQTTAMRIVDWQGRFGLAKKAAVQTTAMRIVDWQGRFGFSQEVRTPGDGHAWEPPQHGMTFPRIAAQYIRASFVDTKTAPLSLTILWPLSNLSGTNLKVGPRKHLIQTARQRLPWMANRGRPG